MPLKLGDSLKLVTFNAINECYRDGTLTSPLKTGIIRLLRKGQKDLTFLPLPQQTDDSCFKRRGESSVSVALIDGIECHQFEAMTFSYQ